MTNKMKKLMGILLTLAMVIGLLPGMSLTAYAEQTEELLTIITSDSNWNPIYSVSGRATLETSGDVEKGRVLDPERNIIYVVSAQQLPFFEKTCPRTVDSESIRRLLKLPFPTPQLQV